MLKKDFPQENITNTYFCITDFMKFLSFSSIVVILQIIPRFLPFLMSEDHSLFPSREERQATM